MLYSTFRKEIMQGDYTMFSKQNVVRLREVIRNEIVRRKRGINLFSWIRFLYYPKRYQRKLWIKVSKRYCWRRKKKSRSVLNAIIYDNEITTKRNYHSTGWRSMWAYLLFGQNPKRYTHRPKSQSQSFWILPCPRFPRRKRILKSKEGD